MRAALSAEDLHAAYRAHGGELYGFARRALGDAPLAEDAVQEAFLRAWRSSARYDPDVATTRTWLFAILRNVVVDLARARQRHPALPVGSDGYVPTDELDQLLVGWEVEEALRRLAPHHREVLLEVHIRDRPYAEVAADLGLPEGTVKSRVFYALKAMRLVLDEMGAGT